MNKFLSAFLFSIAIVVSSSAHARCDREREMLRSHEKYLDRLKTGKTACYYGIFGAIWFPPAAIVGLAWGGTIELLLPHEERFLQRLKDQYAACMAR